MAEWMVMTDVGAVQAYLFSGLHLREAAGASTLLVEHDRALESLAADHGGETVFSAGGSALAVFASEAEGSAFVAALTTSLAARAPGATLSWGGPIEITSSFRAARDEALRHLERIKRLGRNPGEAVGVAFGLPCDGCGTEPALAGVEVRVGDDLLRLGVRCQARHRARDRAWWLALAGLDGGARLPRHTADLAGGDLLAIVVADADGAGDRLRNIDSKDEYQRFSHGLADAVRGALSDALRAVIRPGEPLPVDVLYAGGDDVVVAIRGSVALSFARTLVSGFTDRTHGGTWCEGGLGMSAAIALVGPTFPFRTAHDLAADLLRAAKAAARKRGWSEGAVDWALVTESWSSAERVEADRVLRLPDGRELRLAGRPYRAASDGPGSLGSFERACRELAPGFPRSKLFDLRELCSVGTHSVPSRPTAADLDSVRTGVQDGYDRWVARVTRRPEQERTWRHVEDLLGLEAHQAFRQMDAVEITPLGDLADAVALWGEP